MAKVGLGVIGLGRAFSLMVPTFVRDGRFELVGGADPRPEARAAFEAAFDAPAHADAEALCADPRVAAVYVASPHHLHAEHAVMGAWAGKHLLVEKPFALTLEAGQAMVEAAAENGVQLVAGPSHGFDAPVLRARAIIESGEVGPVRMIQAANYTDFLYRPRRPEELDTAAGGGVVFGQAPHQVDVARLLGGGRVRSVRAWLGRWDSARPTEGAYLATLEFEDGVVASLTYSGYGHFDSDELLGGWGELGRRKQAEAYGAARRALPRPGAAETEAALRAARAFGGANAGDPAAAPAPGAHEHFGFVLASCEKGDLWPTAEGVTVFGDHERRTEAMPVPAIPRKGVMDELYGAVAEGRPPLHSGAWGLATLEVCLGMLRSAEEGREVPMTLQVPAAAVSRPDAP